MRDVKEVVGILMRILGGAEITEDDVRDLEFEADDELQAVLDETYIKLLEFVHDPPSATRIGSSIAALGQRCRTR